MNCSYNGEQECGDLKKKSGNAQPALRYFSVSSITVSRKVAIVVFLHGNYG